MMLKNLSVFGVVLWAVGTASAADVTPPPPTYAAPAMIADPGVGCATCGPVANPTCNQCGTERFGHKHGKALRTVNLCPGACFGYFQTQWRKWDEACPLPYQGTGVTDAPRPPSAPLIPSSVPKNFNPKGTPADPQPKTDPTKGKGSELPPPRTTPPGTIPMPMKNGSDTLPSIPLPPPVGGSKF